MSARRSGGHAIELLENGEEYFPAVFAAIEAAQHEVLIETFIVFEDKVGMELHAVLLRAAARGVRIDLLVDGFGSADLSDEYTSTLTAVGVRLRVFDPARRLFGVRFNVLRRMHRKIVVVDGHTAFIGGINFSADHLADFGAEAKQDYSASVRGPVVEQVRTFVLRQIGARPGRVGSPATTPLTQARAQARSQAQTQPQPTPPSHSGSAETLFVTRDNHVHHNAIERHYRAAIRSARRRVVIANAYFFPGYLLLREMRRAARRGVDVRLILQGKPDMPIVRSAALLYEHLQNDGVRVFEYCKRPLHGKVAVVDEQWSTIGSSNLDPLSLSLNLEANLIVRDEAFNRELGERLDVLMAESCREVARPAARRWRWWNQARNTLLFHLLRAFPVWAGWLPGHGVKPQIADVKPQTADVPAAHPG
jgi:cardiolipin synthase